MLRIVLVVLVLMVGGALALWQFGNVELPLLPKRGDTSQRGPTQTLFALAKSGDPAAVRASLSEGADLGARDEYGQTPLMYAAGSSGSREVLELMINVGADLNAQTDAGWSALMYAARDAKDLEPILMLMNAGADPSLRNSEGQSAADLARGNSAMSTALYGRLRELADAPFDRDWPSGYTVPVEGATISSRASHLPGAPRPYRNGTHEGFDFYGGSVSVPISFGTPIRAVASGQVIRADHGYQEMSVEEYERLIETAKRTLNTPADILDKLRGQQVWIEHAGGFVSRYAHLSGIPAGVNVGSRVSQGDVVGETGNSGTLEAARNTQDDPHPHVEIWKGDTYLGRNLTPEQIYDLAGQVFGNAARPPYFGE